MIREIKNLDEMRDFAAEIAARLPKRALVLLEGPMAAGKTQFTKFLVEALGLSGPGTHSPSFALHHSYATKRGSVEHFDLFRLENADDLESAGFWDFFRAPEGIVVIEWSERLVEFGVFDHLPRSWPRTVIAIAPGASPDERRVTISSS